MLVVSLDARNRHPKAETVLVIPLTTSIHRQVPTHAILTAAETGLAEDSAARAEDVTVVRKQELVQPRHRLRQISETRICELAGKVCLAMGCTA